jgi:hypothetical protein
MGRITIETIRPGVEFVPDAAAAFRRAEARVREEFGRNIDVNSTYRSWDQQLQWHHESLKYRQGLIAWPGHSYATHPSNSFHVAGTALDSDDWTNSRILAILADNGFIRNRLYVPNENHHFEWLRDHDNHYGEPIPGSESEPEEDDDMKVIIKKGAPDSGIILQAGIPPYSLPAQVLKALCGAFGIKTIVELEDWQYDTVVREQWAAFTAAKVSGAI